MRAWLIVNAFLQQQKFNEIHQWLYQAGVGQGVSIEIKTNAQLLACVGQDGLALSRQARLVDFVLFWDKDVLLARTLEQLGFSVFNCAHAIEACDNKALTHLYLGAQKIPMPDTILAPMTYANIGYTDLAFAEEVMEQLGLPLVIKECYGSFGQQVYLCKDREDVYRKIKELEGKEFLFQRFLSCTAGRDVRLQVVGDQVVASMERHAKDGDFRANITNGGTMQVYHPSSEEEALAVRCCEILQADFAGVDLLFLEDGSPVVCEVNSNAHFKNIYDCTGVNSANYIVAHIIEKRGRKHEA